VIKKNIFLIIIFHFLKYFAARKGEERAKSEKFLLMAFYLLKNGNEQEANRANGLTMHREGFELEGSRHIYSGRSGKTGEKEERRANKILM
jgi:hypothetical protein